MRSETIGERIHKRRLELGLSVDDLAAALGKNRATVYRYENSSISNLPSGVLEPLARARGQRRARNAPPNANRGKAPRPERKANHARGQRRARTARPTAREGNNSASPRPFPRAHNRLCRG